MDDCPPNEPFHPFRPRRDNFHESALHSPDKVIKE